MSSSSSITVSIYPTPNSNIPAASIDDSNYSDTFTLNTTLGSVSIVSNDTSNLAAS
jgi:hypothetical protein